MSKENAFINIKHYTIMFASISFKTSQSFLVAYIGLNIIAKQKKIEIKVK